MTEKKTEKIQEKKQIEQKEEKSTQTKQVAKEENGFLANKKYITICKYVLFVIACGAIIVMLISQWNRTKDSISNLLRVLSPFLAALLIAYFISPLVEKINGFLQKYIVKGKAKRASKYVSIALAYIIVLAFIALACCFVIPQLAESIRDLTGNVPEMYDNIVHFIMNLEKNYPDVNFEWLLAKLDGLVPDLVDFGTNLVGDVIPWVYSLSMSLVSLVINILLSIMISVYMISGKKGFQYQMKRLAYAIFDEKKGNAVCNTCRECNNIFSSFLIGKALDSFIIGCLCCVLTNILDLPYAVLISVIVGVTNMIPYFGPFIGAVPGIIIYLCTSPRDAIVFTIMIFLLQQFDGLVLGPKILGDSTGLGPLWVIFAITVGGAYFGVIGMFIGVPTVAVIAHLTNKMIKFRLRGKSIPALEKYKEE